jgi:hypothetical protein
MKCSNCGREQDSTISLNGSDGLPQDMCMICLEEWAKEQTWVQPDGTLVKNGVVVGKMEGLAKK